MSRSTARRLLLSSIPVQTTFVAVSSSDISEKVVNGRCKLTGLIMSKDKSNVAVGGTAYGLFMTLKNGSTSGDVVARFPWINQSASGNQYCSGVSIDIPGLLLFDDGIFIEIPKLSAGGNGGAGVTLIYQGGDRSNG